jgi:hypothetical protein
VFLRLVSNGDKHPRDIRDRANQTINSIMTFVSIPASMLLSMGGERLFSYKQSA